MRQRLGNIRPTPGPAERSPVPRRTRRILRHATRPAIRFPLTLGAMLLASLVGPLQLPSAAFAQEAPAPTTPAPAPSRADTPLADPVVDAPAEIHARKVSQWFQGESRWMLLDGDVTFGVGTYGFRANQAVVRIDTETVNGRVIRHFMAYLDTARAMPGKGPVQAQAPRLLVTASTTGAVQLVTDLLENRSAQGDPLTLDAVGRFERHLTAVNAPTLPVPAGDPSITPKELAQRKLTRDEIERQTGQRAEEAIRKLMDKRLAKGLPLDMAGPTVATTQGAPGTSPGTQPGETAGTVPGGTTPGGSPSTESVVQVGSTRAGFDPATRILPGKGIVSFTAEKVVFEAAKGEGAARGENLLMLIGGVRVVYQNLEGFPGATLSADRAVIFVNGKSLTGGGDRKIEAGDIRGIYLEDNVIATYDQYTVRAPRVYYDLARNKAVVLDAVMYAWDIKRDIPLYVRAEKFRQEAANSWVASNAILTNSEFAEPHFAIASRQITIHQDPDPKGGYDQSFVSRDTTIRLGQTPVFWWPKVSGDTQESALRDITGGYSKREGPLVSTTWDLYSLSGEHRPEGVDIAGRLDFRGDHGPGTGVSAHYDRPTTYGSFRGYILPYDQGDAEIGGRDKIGFDGDLRGDVRWQHREIMPDHWELSFETAYASDPLILEQFFRPSAETEKPYETSFYAKKQVDDWAFTFLTRYDLNDFLPQTVPLQAPGYTVDRLPELGYYRIGTSLWDDRLTWYSENRGSVVRIRPGTETPASRGFTSLQSQLLFGIPPTQSFDAAADAAGLPDDTTLRLDNRQELQARMKAGPVNVVPYVVGRFTGYNQDFEEYAGEDQADRFWGSVGVRLDTQFSKTYNQFESQLLDVHRIRHILQPNANLYLSGSTLDSNDLPVFDPTVEHLQDGPGARIGLRNTLETQRGGAGQWRSVEWLVVNTDVTFQGRGNNPDTLISRFIEFRPEENLGDDHFHADAMWQVSDTLAGIGEITKNLADGTTAQWRAGVVMQHSPVLTTYMDYTELDALDSRYFTWGFFYKLTSKYSMGFRHSYELSHSHDQVIDVTLTRKLPRWRLGVLARYDSIDDDKTIGIVLIPDGVRFGALDDPFAMRFLGQ
ncbi:MAG: LPS assembly protein LptD [Planctomycetota bacterium]|nr:LPS assembly protein LptD [Planctomycetota bacterium]